jgi:hypothetical protein
MARRSAYVKLRADKTASSKDAGLVSSLLTAGNWEGLKEIHSATNWVGQKEDWTANRWVES